MPFPFLWLGAIVAGVFLTIVLTIFGLAMRMLNRATADVRGSMLPGLVSGFRDWAAEAGPAIRRMVSPRSSEPEVTIEETPPSAGPPTERLHPQMH